MDLAVTVLILSSNPADWAEAAELLRARQGLRIVMSETVAQAAAHLADIHVDAVIAEDEPDAGDALSFLARLRKSHPAIVRVLAVAPTAQVPQRAAKEAALYLYLHKPIDAEQLVLVVQRGLEARDMERRQRLLARDLRRSADEPETTWPASSLQWEARHFETLVYASEAMGEVCDQAAEAAGTDMPVLIQGEGGVGKEWLARAIHARSARQAAPFMAQKCAGNNDERLLVELFGAGDEEAGKSRGRPGVFEAGKGGTVFLAEISEMSKPVQAHLLRFLERESKDAARTGEQPREQPRIIVSATRPLKNLAAKGDFRQELYIRLRAFELDIPPLRARADDIPVLAELFTAKHSAACGRRILGMTTSALEKLVAYDFPGNVRELESEIRRMVALAKDGEYLTSRLMSSAILDAPQQTPHWGAAFSPTGATLKDKVESLERHVLREALLRHKWNRSRVAETLGLSRVGLANKIRRYGLNEHR